MMVAAIYSFITALSGWDPFYALFAKFWKQYKNSAAIRGRF